MNEGDNKYIYFLKNIRVWLGFGLVMLLKLCFLKFKIVFYLELFFIVIDYFNMITF